MNARSFLAISLSLNMLLILVWGILLHRRDSLSPTELLPPTTSLPAAAGIARAPLAGESSAPPVSAFQWRLIQSKDYEHYLVNLRAVECPEWLIRNIIVADINDFYLGKSDPGPDSIPLWHTARRRAEGLASSARNYNLQLEKRGLIKDLLGYNWDNDDNKVWSQDLSASLLLGFLPDDKAEQIIAVLGKYNDAASRVREKANGILIDEDHAQLQTLYDGLVAEATPLLDASEMGELQLRVQAALFFAANDIHFEGFSPSDEELREITRFSKSVDDAFEDEFTAARPPVAEERERRRAAFEEQVKNLLGTERFVDYQRAQDFDFRDTFEFTEKNHLLKDVAIKTYEVRQAAEDEAGKVMIDKSLSPESQAEVLSSLKATTAGAISSVLGDSYPEYRQGPGWWLENLSQQPKNWTP